MIPIYNRKSMHTARIAELLQPFLTDPCHSEQGRRRGEESVSALLLNHISTYIDLLLHWNTRTNLTAIRNEEEIVTRHFGESLFVARHLFPLYPMSSSVSPVVKAFDVADLGSGAGFPGIPIKLWAPEISMTLIESNHKKSTFLREIVRALKLTDVDVVNDRAETIAETINDAFDLVTLRAVERFSHILPTAARLTEPGGSLALLIGSAQLENAREALPAFSWDDPIPIPLSNSRVLALGCRT
jgi:16S rRNA (guanine527-N7)-methyltransferase